MLIGDSSDAPEISLAIPIFTPSSRSLDISVDSLHPNSPKDDSLQLPTFACLGCVYFLNLEVIVQFFSPIASCPKRMSSGMRASDLRYARVKIPPVYNLILTPVAAVRLRWPSFNDSLDASAGVMFLIALSSNMLQYYFSCRHQCVDVKPYNRWGNLASLFMYINIWQTWNAFQLQCNILTGVRPRLVGPVSISSSCLTMFCENPDNVVKKNEWGIVRDFRCRVVTAWCGGWSNVFILLTFIWEAGRWSMIWLPLGG